MAMISKKKPYLMIIDQYMWLMIVPDYIWVVDVAIVANKTATHDSLQELISCCIRGSTDQQTRLCS